MTAVHAIDEVPWRLDVNGELTASGTVLPSALERFFAGRLAGDGVIATRDDLLSLEVARRPDGILHARALVALARARAAAEERRHRAQHGCGALYLATCATRRSTRGRATHPELEVFPDLFRGLFAEADSRHEGGVHAAALCDGASLSHQFEDVGRHNAVDKAIGGGILDEIDLSAHGLVVTARISGEMAAKAVRAGLGWVASRSVPTTLAVRVAEANGVALIARAPSKDAAIFAETP
jgi:FdhD protein